jgi:hypothetical protein
MRQSRSRQKEPDSSSKYAVYAFVGIIICVLLLGKCSGGGETIEEGLTKVHAQFKSYPNYTVLLSDMDSQDDKYTHKYQILIEENDSTFDERETDWMVVSPVFFKKYQNALGMEVSRRENGIVKNSVTPPGYNRYVGNSRYGSWQTNSSGGSFWAFYGQYMFLSRMFSTPYYRPTRSSWTTYNDSYRQRDRDYYGSSGSYGTNRHFNSEKGKNSSWAKKPSSFRDNVKTKVSRSASRYSKSVSRSRSGGYGK